MDAESLQGSGRKNYAKNIPTGSPDLTLDLPVIDNASSDASFMSEPPSRRAADRRSWATVGVSDNVIEGSSLALVDAIRLKLMRLTEQDDNIDKVVEDYCWGV